LVTQLLLSLATLIFSFALLSLWLSNEKYGFKSLPILLSVIVWLGATWGVSAFACKYQALLEHHRAVIFLASFILFFLIQSFFGYWLALDMAWDTEAVYQGAVLLAKDGDLGWKTEYFYRFPHNLGSVFFLYPFFKMAVVFGVDDLNPIGVCINIFCINLAYLFCALIAYKRFGIVVAAVAVFLMFTCLPLLFYTPVFYSDTLSMPFIPLAYWLFTKAQDSDSIRSSLRFGVLAGLFVAIGALIKFTVIFIVIAMVIECLAFRLKKSLVIFVVIALVLSVTLYSLGGSAYRDATLDKERLARDGLPYAYWVMTGLKGGYSGQDHGKMASLSSFQEREQYAFQEIRRRLSNYGFWGYLKFLGEKQNINFGSGGFEVSVMIDDKPRRQSILQEFGFPNGKYHGIYYYFSQTHYVMAFFLFVLSLWLALFSPVPSYLGVFGLQLSVLGLYAFLLVWEAGNRFIINYIPLILLLAASSTPAFFEWLNRGLKSLYSYFERSSALLRSS
jgi:hypothetical protein